MKHTVRNRELDGLGFRESLYPAKLTQPRHTHALASFSFVLGGSYIETYGAQPLTRQASTLVFHPPQESHAVEFQSEPVRILSVQIDATRHSYLRERAFILDSSASRRTETIDWLGRRIYREFRQKDTASAQARKLL